ncbi:MAG: TetR/AcrR family transcriptional regulator [Acidimicrobiia bacterium]
MGNVVAALADRAVSGRHEAAAADVRSLLDAALHVMQRDDTLDPPVAQIVKVSGLSNQAFYRHFAGKDALLVALLADGRERLALTIERRMDRAETRDDAIRAWVLAVLDQARDPKAAAATRPFVANSDRLAVAYPDEVAASRAALMRPLENVVGAVEARAVFHLAMGSMHDAVGARRTITRRQADEICDFAVRGCSPRVERP